MKRHKRDVFPSTLNRVFPFTTALCECEEKARAHHSVAVTNRNFYALNFSIISTCYIFHFYSLLFLSTRSVSMENVLSLVGRFMCVRLTLSFPHICPSTSVRALVCVCACALVSRSLVRATVAPILCSISFCPYAPALALPYFPHYIIRSSASPSRSLAHRFTKTLVGCVTI